jgi:glucuronoarabinoxylan endo-1,4-beta-xylanase
MRRLRLVPTTCLLALSLSGCSGSASSSTTPDTGPGHDLGNGGREPDPAGNGVADSGFGSVVRADGGFGPGISADAGTGGSSRDSGATMPAERLDGLEVTSPLQLSSSTVAIGQTLTGTVTLHNPTLSPIVLQADDIAARPPGGTNSGGPYLDLYDGPGTTVAPGASFTLSQGRAVTASDPTGRWYAYVTVEDSSGMYHDSSLDVSFMVAAAGTATGTGTGTGTGEGTGTGTGTSTDVTADFVASWNNTRQTIEGFGGSDAELDDIDPAWIDAFYCVNAADPGCSHAGIGLTLLRSVITPSGSTQGGDWNNQQAVAARGGLCWGVPWNVNNCSPGSALATGDYQSWADTLASFATSAKSNGVAIYAISAQNEPDVNANGDCLYSASQMAAFLEVLGPTLHGLSSSGLAVKAMGPETSWPGDFQNNYAPAIVAETAANAAIDIFTTHQYGTFNGGSTADYSHPVWETEVSDYMSSFDPSIDNAVNEISTWIFDAVATYGVAAWHYWWLIMPSFNNQDNEAIVGGAAGDTVSAPTMTKRYFAYGNWSRYIRPGWVQVGVSGSMSGLYGVAAFKDPTSGAFAIVAINNSGADIQGVTFGLSGASIEGAVTPYVTSGTSIGALGTDGNLSTGSASSNIPTSLAVNGGVFTSTVPYGVTTFVGKT